MEENSQGNSNSYKVVLVGESGVGKTSITSYFLYNTFKREEITITATFAQKSIEIKDINKTIEFDIWDTAGQEQYRSLAKLFYNEAKAAILVYDITDKRSFQEIQNYWFKEIKEKSPDAVKYI